jgi:hypothetical protein
MADACRWGLALQQIQSLVWLKYGLVSCVKVKGSQLATKVLVTNIGVKGINM